MATLLFGLGDSASELRLEDDLGAAKSAEWLCLLVTEPRSEKRDLSEMSMPPCGAEDEWPLSLCSVVIRRCLALPLSKFSGWSAAAREEAALSAFLACFSSSCAWNFTRQLSITASPSPGVLYRGTRDR